MNTGKAIAPALVLGTLLSSLPANGQTVVATDENLKVQLVEIPAWDMVPYDPYISNPPQGAFDLSYSVTPSFDCDKAVSVNPVIHSDPISTGAYYIFGFVRMNTSAQLKYTRGGMLNTNCSDNPKWMGLYLNQRHFGAWSTSYFITTRIQTSLLGQFRSTAQRRGWIKFEYFQ